jgi:tetratricopeptide (TPR) repeat protein
MFRKALFAAALLVSTAAQADWHEAVSRHFVVYADASPERVKEFATRMERFDKALKALRGVPEVDYGTATKVTVYVVPSIADIQKLFGSPTQRVGAFYIPRAAGSVAFAPLSSGSGSQFEASAQRILLHEYGHHFMYVDWPSAVIPKWFSEGFAEFNSTAIFNQDGSITFGAPPLDRGTGILMINQMPMSRMIKLDPGKLAPEENYALYSRGWLLTHYLTFEPERRKQLAAYISALNAGKSAEEAAQVFGSLDNLDRKLNAYMKMPRFQTVTITPDQLDIGEVKVRKLAAGEAAVMPARIRSSRGVGPDTAPQVLALARRLAAPYPNDAAAQNELAEAEFDARNFAEAEAAADRAIKADPKSVHALLYKGMALQALAEKAKSTDSAQWQTIRRWYAAANKIDPEDPQPLINYYQTYEAQKIAPPKVAEDGLIYAFALAPHDLGLRLDAAKVFLRRGDAEKARRALVPVAFSEKTGPTLSAILRETVATLDKSGPAAALADYEKRLEEEKAKAKAKAEKG